MCSLLEMSDWVLEATPLDGSAITNSSARKWIAEHRRELSPTEYSEARDHMFGLGLIGRKPGPGGMIYRTHAVPQPAPASNLLDWNIESNLYVPVSNYLHLSFARHPDTEIGVDVKALDVSRNLHAASGRWSVPDLLLISKQSYEFFDGYDLEVISFEVKTEGGLGDRPVYQAYAQSAFAHSGYLLWHCADRALRNLQIPRLKVDCKNTGIGLIVCSDPLDHATYEIVNIAMKKQISKATADRFLSDILNAQQTEAVMTWLKAL